MVLLVGNGTFDDEDERPRPFFRRVVQKFHEVVADFVGEERIVKANLRDAGDEAEHQVLDAGLRGRSHGDGVAVATKGGGNPENFDFFDLHRATSRKSNFAAYSLT